MQMEFDIAHMDDDIGCQVGCYKPAKISKSFFYHDRRYFDIGNEKHKYNHIFSSTH